MIIQFNSNDATLQKETASIDIKAERKTFILYFTLLLVIFVGVCFNPIVSTVIASICLILVFLGPQKTIQAISLLVLIRFMNPALVVYSANLSLFSWGVLILASLINIPWGMMNVSRQLIPIVVFSIFAALLSTITSGAVWISILKIISFLLAAMTVISLFNKLSVNQIRKVEIWLFALMSVIVILSGFTLLNRNIAYNLNGLGFQGILNHPQTMGVFLAPLVSFYIGRFMFEKKGFFSTDAVIISLLIYFIIITQARTAAVAVFLSFIFTLLVINLPIIRAKIKSKAGFVAKLIIATLGIVVVISFYPSLLDVVHDFVFKRESTGLDEALSSRSGGLSSQLDNFLASPVFGNGFGVYPGSAPAKSIQYFMGIPISAAVEKGFLPTALLEEVGLLGAIPFMFMMYSIIRLAMRNIAPSWLCMFFASIFINIGECVFFATGGMGIFYWIIMILCTVTYKKEIEIR